MNEREREKKKPRTHFYTLKMTQAPSPPLTAWSADCAGTLIHFAVLDFGRQLLVWASPSPALGALALAAGAPPAAATLLAATGGGADDAPSRALAVRLAARLGRPVLAAWGVPSGGASAAVGVAAERELVGRLGAMGHVGGGGGGA